MHFLRTLLLPLLGTLAATAALPAQGPALEPYAKVNALQGRLRVVGSDAQLDVATLWAEGFKTFYPAVTVQVEGGGSELAPVVLKDRTADFGLSTRLFTDAEKTSFGDRMKDIVPVRVVTDVLAVFVHKDNPTTGLSIPQLERIFGAQPKAGQPYKTWAETGATGELAGRPYVLIGREPGTGVLARFRNVVLGGGAFRPELQAMSGPAAVVRGVASDPGAIGIGLLRTRTNRVRAIALGATPDQLSEPSAEACASGRYPLALPLYLIFEKSSDAAVMRLRSEFLRFILSEDGQGIARNAGLIPTAAAAAQEELARLK